MTKQAGLSLIEVMISLVIGLALLVAIISIYGVVVRGSRDTLNSARLNHNIEAAMNLMASEIRRSGYWRNATVSANPLLNPFMLEKSDLSIKNGGDCILYSYDANDADGEDDGSGDGNSTNDIENDEYYGFKLENGAIRMRLSISDSDSADDCDHGAWGIFTDVNQINISELTFASNIALDNRCLNFTTTERTCSAAITGDELAEKRIIDITITGNLISDPNVTHTLSSRVEVRNNRLYIK